MTTRCPPAAWAPSARRLSALPGGGFLGGIAVQIQTVAVGWQVYAISHQPLDLGPDRALAVPALRPARSAGRPARRSARPASNPRRLLCAPGRRCGAAAGAVSSAALERRADPRSHDARRCGARLQHAPGQALLPNLVPSASFGNAIASAELPLGDRQHRRARAGWHPVPAGPSVAFGAAATLLFVATSSLLALRPPRATRVSGAARAPRVFSGLRFVRFAADRARRRSHSTCSRSSSAARLPSFRSTRATSSRVGPVGLGIAPRRRSGRSAAGAVTLSPLRRRQWAAGSSAALRLSARHHRLRPVASFSDLAAALVVLGGADMVSVYIRHLLVQLETPDADPRPGERRELRSSSAPRTSLASSSPASWRRVFGLVPAVLIGGGGHARGGDHSGRASSRCFAASASLSAAGARRWRRRRAVRGVGARIGRMLSIPSPSSSARSSCTGTASSSPPRSWPAALLGARMRGARARTRSGVVDAASRHGRPL